MNSIRILILFLYTPLIALATDGNPQPPSDSSTIVLRNFNQDVLQKLKNNPELSYAHTPAVINLWERFKIWLNNLINSLFVAATTIDWVNILIIAATLLIIIYVVMRLLKVDPLNMFYPKASTVKAGIIEEDIHSLDFEKLLREAVEKEHYRLAIRLVFLQALKLLADRHHIHWQPGKTNHDYLAELTAPELRNGFNELNFYFEYAWYGNFAITREVFARVAALYENWKPKV